MTLMMIWRRPSTTASSVCRGRRLPSDSPRHGDRISYTGDATVATAEVRRATEPRTPACEPFVMN